MKLLLLFLLLPFAAFGQLVSGTIASGSFGGVWAVEEPEEPAAPSSLTSNLVAYWSLDNGTTWSDWGPNNFTLIETGAVTAVSGHITNAASFDSNSVNYLYYPDHSAFSVGASNFTFAFWVKLNTTNTSQGLVSKDDANSNREYTMYWSHVANTFVLGNATNATANLVYCYAPTNGVVPGNWYFVAAQVNTPTRQSRIRSGTTSTLSAWSAGVVYGWSAMNTTAPFRVGQRNDTIPVNGLVDELAIYNRTLSDAEVTNLWSITQGYPFQ